MLGAAVAWTLIVGFFAVLYFDGTEKDRLLLELRQANQRELGLLVSTSQHALTTQDSTMLDSMVGQVVQLDLNISSITIENHEGAVVADWRDDVRADLDTRMVLSQDVLSHEQIVGKVTMVWNTERVIEEIHHHANHSAFISIVILVSTLVAFSGVVYLVVARPIARIHCNLLNLQSGRRLLGPVLPHYAAHELAALGQSVHDLEELLGAQQQREIELKLSQERFKDIAKAASDWFWETDSMLRFTYISERLFEFGEVDQDDLIGKSLYDLGAIDPDDREREEKFAALSARKPFRALRMLRVVADGTIRWASLSAKPLHDQQGRFTGYRGTGSDITPVIEARQTAEQAAEQLREAEKMNTIGQLTAGIAHDFNNILQLIDGFGRQARNDLNDPRAADDCLEEVLLATSRGADLTKQLLSFSRRQIAERHVFEAGAAIKEIEGLLRQAAGSECEVEFELDTEVAYVESDRGELSQAILNLTINARDAMEEQGGEIVVGTRIVELEQSSVDPYEDVKPGKFVEVFVKDQGPGIDDTVLPHIFEPFFTTKEEGKGTGLGLAMVYGFSRQCGGFSGITSAIGTGTTVHIYLPQINRKPPGPEEGVDTVQHGNDGTVLLVEEDVSLRGLIECMLEELSCKVLSAANRDEALELEASYENDIDLLLSNVEPSEHGGIEFAKTIRDKRPHIEIVLMSGALELSPVLEGAVVLRKPFKSQQLAEAVRAKLDQTESLAAG